MRSVNKMQILSNCHFQYTSHHNQFDIVMYCLGLMLFICHDCVNLLNNTHHLYCVAERSEAPACEARVAGSIPVEDTYIHYSNSICLFRQFLLAKTDTPSDVKPRYTS